MLYARSTHPQRSQDSRTSVDHTADGGYLDCARTIFVASKDHANTTGAVTNLLHDLPEKAKMNLVGHGMVGLINTGTGNTGCPADLYECISINNPEKWQVDIPRLKSHCTSLTFWACDTGAGQDGVDLLYAIALQSCAPVCAPTGIICCEPGKLWLPEPGATWQIAYPDKAKPPKIDLPVRSLHLVPFLFVPSLKQKSRIPLAEINSLRVFPSIQSDQFFEIDTFEGLRLLQLVDLDHPEQTKCNLATILTGKLVLRATNGETIRTLIIHNNRILQDSQDTTTYYYSFDSSFGIALTALMQKYR